jgi:hypothetical protein
MLRNSLRLSSNHFGWVVNPEVLFWFSPVIKINLEISWTHWLVSRFCRTLYQLQFLFKNRAKVEIDYVPRVNCLAALSWNTHTHKHLNNPVHVGFEALHLIACWFFWTYFDPEDGGDMFLRNVGWNSTDYTASCPRKWYSSALYMSVYLNEIITELVVLALWACIWVVFGSNPSRNISYTEGFHGFPQTIGVNSRIVPLLVSDCFFPNLFQIIY